jgi:hypothetical protein
MDLTVLGQLTAPVNSAVYWSTLYVSEARAPSSGIDRDDERTQPPRHPRLVWTAP